MRLSESERAVLSAAAQRALTPLGVTEVALGDVLGSGSARSVVVRAMADRRAADPLPVVVKASLAQLDGFVREQAALSLLGDYQVPGAVRLLGVCEDPPVLVVEDLGGGDTVADLLLGDDPVVAERALHDWARTVGGLQGATADLGEEFRARVIAGQSRLQPGAEPGPAVATNLMVDWLTEAAEGLAALLEPFDLIPSEAAVGELQSLASAAGRPGSHPRGGLVPGDTCPDNAIYVGGQLTLIDFEAAAHRPAVWEAAYLIVPWPTCWCSWALPQTASRSALATWRQTVAASLPEVTADGFEDDLGQAVIGWAFLSLRFLLPRAAAQSGASADADSGPSADARRWPCARSLIMHRLELAAGYDTAACPALRDLAGQLHRACVQRWGDRPLELAPAFR